MTDDRIAKLEAQINAAQAELAQIKAGKAPPPPTPPKDEVRILQLLDERRDLPSLKEMERLHARVKPLSPWPMALTDRYDEHRPFRGFSSAFRWLQNVGRTPQSNGKVALSFWADCCRIWLRARNCVGSDVDANALILAVLAAGDIVYTPADHARGWVWELGLIEFGGRPANMDAWRAVMSSGAILPPSAPARRDAPPSAVRIYGR
jgi:hypothetical protein